MLHAKQLKPDINVGEESLKAAPQQPWFGQDSFAFDSSKARDIATRLYRKANAEFKPTADQQTSDFLKTFTATYFWFKAYVEQCTLIISKPDAITGYTVKIDPDLQNFIEGGSDDDEEEEEEEEAAEEDEEEQEQEQPEEEEKDDSGSNSDGSFSSGYM